MAVAVEDIRDLRRTLQHAVTACSERCLWNSAKWAAEMLTSLPPNDSDEDDDDEMNDGDDNDTSSPLSGRTDSAELRLQRRERDRYLMAKACFDCKEFDRCAVTLLPSLLPQPPIDRDRATSATISTPKKGKARVSSLPATTQIRSTDLPRLSQKSLFLALYARYIAGEKRKEEDSEMILGPNDGPVTANKELVVLSGILEDYFKAREQQVTIKRQSDGFLEYLYGVVLLKGRNAEIAKDWLLRSVHLFEWNWSAWLELASLVTNLEDLAAICQQLTPSIPAFLFQIYCSQELYQATEALHNKIDQLGTIFPTSPFLATQRALLFYHAKEYESAASIFSTILADHPHRLDSLEIYSNILYVMDSARPKLSYLASLASATDRFRPETCCIIGNHYSKASEHEKAVIYFRRALTLDRSFLAAWTLMGHEYIELKNTQAAIESYRRAVDANRNDHRAWHGLGLGYELLDMHSYALYYHQRAAALQPWDPKMWAAVGAAFRKCARPEHAVRAFKRALAAGSDAGDDAGKRADAGAGADPLAACVGGRLDPDLLFQIATLYEEMGEVGEAAAYVELCLAQEEGPEDEDVPPGQQGGGGTGVTQTTSRARLWLARWAATQGEWERCLELANELCQDGYEVEEAKGLIKDLRGRMGDGGTA